MKTDYHAISGQAQRVFRARHKLREPGLVSHITQRAAGKEPLFVEPHDYLTMLGLLKESAEKFDLRFYALCLMPNHVHMLMEPRKSNLAEAMRSIFSRYAAKFNLRYERRGHLFGGPYRQSVCLDNSYLLAASVYIHLNPVRAGIVEGANDYRWSSSSLYCLDKPRESFVSPLPILQLVNEDPSLARRQYRKILVNACIAEPDNVLEQESAVEKFCLRLADIFPGLFKRLNRKPGNMQGQPPSLLELTELERRMKDVDFSRSRNPEGKKAKKYIVEQLLARGYKKTEISKRLGISCRSVYNILNSSST